MRGEFGTKKWHKGAAIGLKQRDGSIVAKSFDDKKSAEATKEIANQIVSKDATLYTDESLIYPKSPNDYTRETIRDQLVRRRNRLPIRL